MKAYSVNRLLAFLIFVSLLLILSEFSDTARGTEKPLQEKQAIVFTTVLPQNVAYFSELSAIYTEAFRKMGYGFKLISQPGERALVDANEGIVDGEAVRTINIDNKKYPNLIRVPYAIIRVKFGAYSTDHSIKITGWGSLSGKPYRVGILKGYKSFEQKLPLYVDETNIVTLHNFEQGMKMLLAKRMDIFIVGNLIEKSAFMQSGAYKEIKCMGIVETELLYPWLHKRHKNLVRRLADTLKTMKSEGWF